MALILPAWAQEPQVYGPVQPPRKDGWVVLELFSSQVCIFCPKADALMADFAAQEKLIALSCPVDYFGMQGQASGLAACSERQSAYEAALRAGPKYTPQMVLNGRYEVVGYKMADVVKRLEHAAAEPVAPLEIMRDEPPGRYKFLLPAAAVSAASVWVIPYLKPQEVRVEQGANAGQSFVYTNTVRAITKAGPWDGHEKTITVDVAPEAQDAGFVVLVQDDASQRILKAGRITY
jgi:hypothetical protein